MNHQRGDVGALVGMVAVLTGIAVGISFVLIAQHYAKKEKQSVLKTMSRFTNSSPDDPRPKPYMEIVK